mmetsp:Transcript_33097/g.70544  ORF Transcript_33097/g.70544 Transcript_33097/m.70544 type:complete len:273 (-) Transcript_33097:615-1433(-)
MCDSSYPPLRSFAASGPRRPASPRGRRQGHPIQGGCHQHHKVRCQPESRLRSALERHEQGRLGSHGMPEDGHGFCSPVTLDCVPFSISFRFLLQQRQRDACIIRGAVLLQPAIRVAIRAVGEAEPRGVVRQPQGLPPGVTQPLHEGREDGQPREGRGSKTVVQVYLVVLSSGPVGGGGVLFEFRVSNGVYPNRLGFRRVSFAPGRRHHARHCLPCACFDYGGTHRQGLNHSILRQAAGELPPLGQSPRRHPRWRVRRLLDSQIGDRGEQRSA